MSAPVVSVIMAAYKGAALVGETIESVLAQSFGDFELIIVDDCSPDDTLDVLRGFDDPRIRVIESRINQGPVKTRNLAFAQAQGRYIAGLDQDDICLPDRFARQVAYLDAHPDIVLVASAADLLEDGKIRPGRFPGRSTPAWLRFHLHVGNPLVWSSVMFRSETARQLDPFTRPEMLFAEDFDLYHRLGALGPIARIDAPLLHYRIHPGGVSKTYESTMIANAQRVLEEVYRPLFGDQAVDNAALILTHVTHGDPVPDRASLDRIGAIVMALRDRLGGDACDDESRVLIDRTISAMWWRLARTAIRSGTLSPAILTRTRPAPARLGDMHWGDMLVSGMIGAVRRTAA